MGSSAIGTNLIMRSVSKIGINLVQSGPRQNVFLFYFSIHSSLLVYGKY
jgi:hypothetical protein